MSTFCNEKILLLNLKEAVSLLKESLDEEEKKALYYYISSSFDVLESLDNDPNYIPYLIGYNQEECTKYIKQNMDSNNKFAFNIFKEDDKYKNIFNQLIDNYLDVDIDCELEDFKMSKEDFFTIFKMFCDDIGKEKEFDNIYNRGIIKTKYTDSNDYVGKLLFNPSTNKKHIVLTDFDYTFDNLITLIHEFGHYVDFGDLVENNSYKDLYNYLYNTTNIEINSLLYEKLFIKFLIDNKIFVEDAKDYGMSLKYNGLNYIYNTSYLFDSLDDIKQNNVSVNNKKNSSIYSLNNMSIIPNMTYGVGEYYSTILMNDIEKNGLESNLYKKFYSNRHKNMGLEFLNNEDFNSKIFKDVEDKQLQYLKK